MSGVVKDDSKSKPEAQPDGAERNASDAATPEPGPEVSMNQDETDTQTRKPTPHLRVIAGGEEDAAATDATVSADEEADLSTVPTRISDDPEPELPPLFPSADTPSVAVEDDEADGEPKVRIGVAIREQRESLGWTREQVSKELKLHVSVLTAIEDMNPSAIGPRVYAIGHIRDYARHLNLDPGKTLARYKTECAILADPVKKDITPPKTERKGPGAAPAFGLLVVGLAAAGGAFYVFNSSGDAPARPEADPVAASVPTAAEPGAPAPVQVAAPTQTLRIMATKRARVEFRGADGTKFLARYFSPGESYAPRVGAGWTVTTNEGDAFEWRLGDMTLGPLSEDGGPVYAQSVDAALSREATPVEVVEQPTAEFAPTPEPAESTQAQTPATREPAATASPPPQRRSTPAPAPARTRTPPARTAAPEPEPPAEVTDPSLLAYPE